MDERLTPQPRPAAVDQQSYLELKNITQALTVVAQKIAELNTTVQTTLKKLP
jgi:hypothetical protein